MIEPTPIQTNGTWWRIRYAECQTPELQIRLDGISDVIKRWSLCGDVTVFDREAQDVGICGLNKEHRGLHAPEMFLKRSQRVQLGIDRGIA